MGSPFSVIKRKKYRIPYHAAYISLEYLLLITTVNLRTVPFVPNVLLLIIFLILSRFHYEEWGDGKQLIFA